MVGDAPDDGGGGAPSSFGPGGRDGEKTLDALLAALASRRARFVLAHLESADVSVVGLDDLVDHVVEREVEGEIGVDADPEDHRDSVAIELHHSRLPKLDEATVIDYDPRTHTVRYWGDDRAEACLDLLASEEWP